MNDYKLSDLLYLIMYFLYNNFMSSIKHLFIYLFCLCSVYYMMYNYTSRSDAGILIVLQESQKSFNFSVIQLF